MASQFGNFVPALPATMRGGSSRVAGATQTALSYLPKGSQGTLQDKLQAAQDETIDVQGAPSLQIYQQRGGVGTVIELARNSTCALNDADIAPVYDLGRIILARIVAQSQGPLTLKILAQMGHPYGRGPGRNGSRLAGIGRTVKGPAGRGSVPDLTIINRQTGNLMRAWRYEQERTSTGIVMRWINDTPESWFVIRGTITMVAHGPATFVPVQFLGQIDALWRQITAKCKSRQQSIERSVQAHYTEAAKQMVYGALTSSQLTKLRDSCPIIVVAPYAY